MDVLDFASHKAHFQHALRHFGTVDILVNNAGMFNLFYFSGVDFFAQIASILSQIVLYSRQVTESSF